MTATIAYDLPVKNLVDELSLTGHVTHTPYRKDCVTFHHNGGRLSHEGVLRVWQIRPASAQFDVDLVGAVAQYVKANEYAWATGNTEGNRRSVSIELCNETLGPEWRVADTTWKSGARLAGWIFVNIIGARPSASNVFFHHDWLPTMCAGPYMDSIEAPLIAECQRWYDYFRAGRGGGTSAPPPKPAPTKGLAIDGYLGPNTIRTWQRVMRTPADGVISRPSLLVAAVQKRLNAAGARDRNGRALVADGLGIGSNQTGRYPSSGSYHTLEALQRYLGTPVDGHLSSPSSCISALQRRLNTGRF